MKQFSQRNALTATLLNLIINIVAPAIIFRNDVFFNFKGESPTLVDLLVPTVLISVFATTLATFVTMTKQRMEQKLQPVLAPTTNWVGTAVLTSVILAVAFAGLFTLLMTGLHPLLSNVYLSKWVALGLSGVLGAFVAPHNVIYCRKTGQTGLLIQFRGIDRATRQNCVTKTVLW